MSFGETCRFITNINEYPNTDFILKKKPSSELPPCPWEKREVKLDKQKLILDRKTWLGKAIASGKFTAVKLNNKYKLKCTRTLQRWANKIRKGDKLRNSVSRESFLKEEDRKELKTFVHSGIYAEVKRYKS